MTSTWRDRITLVDEVPGYWSDSRPWTSIGRASAEAVLNWLDPLLGLSLLPTPVVVGWTKSGGNWSAQSTDTWITIRDDDGTRQDHAGWWEQSLIHELMHVVDKQLMNDADHELVRKTLTWPAENWGYPVVPTWLDVVWYQWQAGECFAEGYSRHLWYAEHEKLADADLDAWGIYSYDPPVFIAACRSAISSALARRRTELTPAAPVKPVPAPAPAPATPPRKPMTQTTILSPNRYTGRRKPIRVIVLHTMESPEQNNTAEAVGGYFAKLTTKASAHTGVDPNSECRYVKDEDTAWATPGVNSDGLQLEMAGRASQSLANWSDPASVAIIENAAQRTASWCRTWKIPPVRLTNAQLKAGARGIIDHYQATVVYGGSHTDVGKGFPWAKFLSRVGQILGTTVVRPPVVVKPPVVSSRNIPMVMAIQLAVHLSSDGKLGNDTAAGVKAVIDRDLTPVSYLQARVGAYPDGIWGALSQAAWVKTIKRIQMALGVAQDGAFGPISRRAWGIIYSNNYMKF